MLMYNNLFGFARRFHSAYNFAIAHDFVFLMIAFYESVCYSRAV